MDTSVLLLNTSSRITTINRCLFTNTTTTKPTSIRFLKLPQRNGIFSQLSNNNSRVGANHRSSQMVSQPDDNDHAVYTWNPAPQSVVDGDNMNVKITVVLLGWLGAKTKHLRSYVKWYNSRGVNAITFVVDASELLTYELGSKLDQRTSRLADELVSWVLTKEEDGRERCLLFHTFSNTGWLVYGSILDDLQTKHNLMMMDKIKGCIVDSGGAEPFSPQVWATGFTACLTDQKRGGSSRNKTTTILNTDSQVISAPNLPEKEPPQIDEIILLFLFNKLFSILLNLPRLNQRLTRSKSILKEKQPFPQLYLYSSGDEVIPFKSTEMFMEEQRKMGRNVISFNFGSSSDHVEHFLKFRSKYSSLLHDFLKHCFATKIAR